MRTSTQPIAVARALLVAIAALTVGLSIVAAGTAAGIRLDPSKTWVGLARVHLEVDDLRLLGRELQGAYRIRVPLRPSENDVGTIRLTAPSSLQQMRVAGGRLIGDARSAYGKVHSLRCDVRPNGTVLIDVISPERTLSFKTRLHALPGS